jgi:bifunctional non-homologous end joining protein LigD
VVLPELIRPMMASPGRLPGQGQDERWSYEMKWDGVRAVAYADRATWRLMTRNDRNVAATYPELRTLAAALPCDLVLDGEIVAADPGGRPDFGSLQRRMHVQRPSRQLIEAVPVTYLVFDLLWRAGGFLLDAPYGERRARLEELDVVGPRWDTPPVYLGSGEEALAMSRSCGLEGVVAKRIDSSYEPGRRSSRWIKVKHQRMQEVVVGGWKPGEGRRSGGIGSLLLGVPAAEGLRFAGHVGTGFTVAALDHLESLLRPLRRATPPFADAVPAEQAREAVWVQPRLVGEVVFTEWTKDGRLRHPSWRGLRPDKSPQTVRIGD